MKILQIDPEYANNPAFPRDEKALKSYTVLVNPSSYTVDHKICSKHEQGIGAHTTTFNFNKVEAKSMNITLLFDSTGSLGQLPFFVEQPVLDQINYFLDVAFVPPEQKAPPKMLRLIWGKMIFEGILEKVSINYSHFNSVGDPIRAKATCTFSGGEIKFSKPDAIDKDVQKAQKKRKKIGDFAQHKHAINAVIKHGSYASIISKQISDNLPKSLRDNNEILKMLL